MTLPRRLPADGQQTPVRAALGQDVAGDNQPLARMRYAQWASDPGFCYAWVEYYRGPYPVPDAEAHTRALRAAGYLTGAYANLVHTARASADPLSANSSAGGGAADQCAAFLARVLPGDSLPDMLDVEQAGVDEADVRAWCLHHDLHSARRLVIYTGYGAWERIIPSWARGWYAKYKLVIASYPFDSPGEDQPMDAASVALRSNPPAHAAPLIPEPWTWADVLSWQHTGHGSLPGYDSFLDLHVAGPAWEEPMPIQRLIQPRGKLHAMTAEEPFESIPILDKLRANGVTVAGELAIENPGLAHDAELRGVLFAAARCMHPDGNIQGLQNIADWSADYFQSAVASCVQLPFDRSNPEERAHIDAWVPGINEACPNDPDQSGAPPTGRKPYPRGWAAYGRFCKALCEEADRRSREFGPGGLRLFLPGLAQGTPEFSEMEAFAGTGVFDTMYDVDAVFNVHEGPYPWETWPQPSRPPGYGDVIPGAPYCPPHAGSGTGRVLYWYHFFGVRCKFAVGECYDGLDSHALVAARLARMNAMDNAVYRRTPYCLAVHYFLMTRNPKSQWADRDFTDVFASDQMLQELRAAQGEPNPIGDDMPYYTDAQVNQIQAHVDGIKSILAQPSAAWWETWPAGVYDPPRPLPDPTGPIAMRDAAGVPLAGVKPRQNSMDAFERNGDLFRVLGAPLVAGGALWWVKAEELPAPA